MLIPQMPFNGDSMIRKTGRKQIARAANMPLRSRYIARRRSAQPTRLLSQCSERIEMNMCIDLRSIFVHSHFPLLDMSVRASKDMSSLMF